MNKTQIVRALRRRAAGFAALLVLLATVVALAVAPRTADAAAPGAELWRKVHNGPAGLDDAATALALAPGGKAVYVAGSVTAADGVTTDLALIKYAVGGKRLWVRTYDGPAHADDGATAVIRDKAGNIYVGGWARRALRDDWVLVKYDAAGHRRWVRFYGGDSNGNRSRIDALALDADGNVYAAGTILVRHFNYPNLDAALVKWTPSGKRAWARVYVGPADDGYDADDDDGFTALVVDKARGRIYAGGSATVDADTRQWLLARYTTGGTCKWTRLAGSGNRTWLALTPAGAVVQAGGLSVGSARDALVVEWTSAGAAAWTAVYDGGHEDRFQGIAVDRQGVVFAVGYTVTPVSSHDALVCRYTPDGTLSNQITIGGMLPDEFLAVTCDAARNVLATGFEGQAIDDKDWVTVKFDNLLDQVLWQPRGRETDVVHDDIPAAIAVRTGTNPGVYVTGRGARDAATWDWMTIKYRP